MERMHTDIKTRVNLFLSVVKNLNLIALVAPRYDPFIQIP